MGKYIIDLESGTHIFVLGPEGIVHIGEPDVVYETVDGMQIGDAVINAKPYTEPDLEQVRCQAYEEGRNSMLVEVQKAGKNTIKLEEDEYYQRGLSDAWEAAKKIEFSVGNGGLLTDTIAEIFGTPIPNRVLRDFTAYEVIEKLKQYEQEKEEKQHTWICSEAGEPSTDITLICSKCGYTITIKPGDTQALNFCPKCGDNKRGGRDE